MPAQLKYTEEQISEAITQSDGNIAVASRSLKCGKNTVRSYIDRSLKLQQVLKDARECFIDFAEHKLREHIEKNNLVATIFFLKTQAKHRGYVERPEPGSEFDELDVITMKMGDKVLKKTPPNETTH